MKLDPSIFKAIRPFLLAIVAMLLFNLFLGLVYPLSGLQDKTELKYGNAFISKWQSLQRDSSTQGVFLGTSQTNNGFSAPVYFKQTGSLVFNFGLPSAHYPVMQAVLEKYLLENPSPQVVFIELNARLLYAENTHAFMQALYFSRIISPLQQLQWASQLSPDIRQELLWGQLFPLRRYRQSWSPINFFNQSAVKFNTLFEPRSQDLSRSIPVTPIHNTFPLYGWEPRDEQQAMQSQVLQPKLLEEASQYFLAGLNTWQPERLNPLLTRCKKSHLNCVWVVWPNYTGFQALQNRLGIEARQAEMISVVKAQGFPVVDLRETSPAPCQGKQEMRCYSDPVHLSRTAAEAYTQQLSLTALAVRP
jgi:hypothetical protein